MAQLVILFRRYAQFQMNPIPPDSASQFEKMSEGSYDKVAPVIAGYYLGYDITIPDSFRAETKSYPVSPDM